MVLLRLDEPFFRTDGASHKRFTNVHLPLAGLSAMVRGVDNLVGREFEPGGALTLAMDYSELLLRHAAAAEEAGMAIAQHLLDLTALGLAARSEAASLARRRGLRAVCLEGLLAILQRRFSEPDFSAGKLAAAAGLSERYVNELLYEASASFTARLLELRLRRAAEMLAGKPASPMSRSPAASTTCHTSTGVFALASGSRQLRRGRGEERGLS